MVIVPLSGDSPNCSLRFPQEILVSGVWIYRIRIGAQPGEGTHRHGSLEPSFLSIQDAEDI